MLHGSIFKSALTWRFLSAWLATLLLIWGTYAVARGAIADSMEQDLRQRMEIDTLVLEDHASRAIDGVVSSLEALAALSSREAIADNRGFSGKLRDFLFDATILRSLSLVDPDGLIVASSNLANVGRKVSPAVLAGAGPPARQPRPGVRFSESLAQRDLPDTPQAQAVQSIWLAQVDVKSEDLAGYRWIAAINSGFFVNFWAVANKRNDLRMDLLDYDGQRLVSLGAGPAAQDAFRRALRQALQGRDSGELDTDELAGWRIRYRASSRHPLVFVMSAQHALLAQQQFKRTAALRWSALGGSVLATVVIGLFFASATRYRRAVSVSDQLREAARTDPLTAIGNRRAFEEIVPKELERAAAQGRPASLMVLDLDRFKSINDRHGHLAGDAVLREMAARWRASLRSGDLIARVGGEEFHALLTDTGLQQAQAVAAKLVEVTRRAPVVLPGSGATLQVTVSIGVVGCDACPPEAALEALVAEADAALYQAKKAGRDRFVAVGWPAPGPVAGRADPQASDAGLPEAVAAPQPAARA